jgi:hypothetical protein
MAAARSRGALRWIRLPASKRAAWVCFQAARERTPPADVYDRQGVFCDVPLPARQPSRIGKNTAGLSSEHWLFLVGVFPTYLPNIPRKSLHFYTPSLLSIK